MTQEKFKQRAEAAVNRIKSAQIDADLQDSLVELVEDARIATNGLTPDEKIQAMSENQFSMAVLLVQNCIACMQARKNEETSNSWKDEASYKTVFNIRQYQQHLGYSEAWMTEYAFQMIRLAKKEPKKKEDLEAAKEFLKNR